MAISTKASPGAGRWRRSQDLNLLFWEGGVDIAPLLMGIIDQLAIHRHLLGK